MELIGTCEHCGKLNQFVTLRQFEHRPVRVRRSCVDCKLLVWLRRVDIFTSSSPELPPEPTMAHGVRIVEVRR